MASSSIYRQRKLRGRIFRIFYLRLLLVIFGALFIFTYLFPFGISRQNASETFVLSQNDTQNIFARSSGTRVAIFIMSNRINEVVCYSVGSAYLSGLPVVVVGYKMPYFAFTEKFDFIKSAIENAKLKPNDVIVVLDSDTVFTGVDLHPFLDRFITHSAATPEALDALAVRQGRAMAPFIVSGESGCWAPNLFPTNTACKIGVEFYYQRLRDYAAKHPELNLTLTFDSSRQRYMNSGAVTARVWAYKEFLERKNNLIMTQPPPVKARKKWYCDQSIFMILYLDLITWEADRGVFLLPLHKQQGMRSSYGVRAGFFDIDFANEFATVDTLDYIHLSEIHNEHWVRYLPQDGLVHPNSHEVANLASMGRFVGNLYRQAYAAHGYEIYTRLAVPKWVSRGRASRNTHIILTPPLLALKPRPMDTIKNKTRHVFQVIFHAAGTESGYSKLAKMEFGILSARWFVPMVLDPEIKKTRHDVPSIRAAVSVNRYFYHSRFVPRSMRLPIRKNY